MEFAKLNATLAYSINSLYHSYMSLNHISKDEHPILQEINRVRQYIGKIKIASEKTISEDNRKLHLDPEAAKRLIKSNLNEDERKVKPHQAAIPNERTKNPKNKIIEITEEEIESKLNTIEQGTIAGGKRKLIKGSILPSQKHLNWKKDLDSIMKNN